MDNKDLVAVEMYVRQECNICGREAKYDGKTTSGVWVYMCQCCFNLVGVGLGMGKGQKLIYKDNYD